MKDLVKIFCTEKLYCKQLSLARKGTQMCFDNFRNFSHQKSRKELLNQVRGGKQVNYATSF